MYIFELSNEILVSFLVHWTMHCENCRSKKKTENKERQKVPRNNFHKG